MHFDVVFLDVISNKYYDRTTLENHALGGTEATVMRIAEALGQLKLSVAVVESKVNYFEPIMGQFCFFLHSDDIPKLTCRHYIQLRRNLNPHLFLKAKKYLWLHDLASAEETSQIANIKDNNIQIIGVSRWHKNNIKEYIPNYDNITYIYNPVLDSIYVDTSAPRSYDKNIMVWAASPHKGLYKAVEMFSKIKLQLPLMQLIVFNPGYAGLDNVKLSTVPGVTVYGPQNCWTLWSVIQKALCVFYPTEWKETFGLIAAEANALGTPILTNSLAALKEVVSTDSQFGNTEEEIISQVISWHSGNRPIVVGRDEFRLSTIVLEWVK